MDSHYGPHNYTYTPDKYTGYFKLRKSYIIRKWYILCQYDTPPPHYNHVIFMMKSRQIFFVIRPSNCWKSVEGRQMTVVGRWCERPPTLPNTVHVPYLLRSASVHRRSHTVILIFCRPSADVSFQVPTEYRYCTVLWGCIKRRILWATPHLLTRAQPTWNKLKSLLKWNPGACWLFCRMKLTRMILPCTCTWRNSLVCTISW